MICRCRCLLHYIHLLTVLPFLFDLLNRLLCIIAILLVTQCKNKMKIGFFHQIAFQLITQMVFYCNNYQINRMEPGRAKRLKHYWL